MNFILLTILALCLATGSARKRRSEDSQENAIDAVELVKVPRDNYLVRNGVNLRVPCEFASEHASEHVEIKWLNADGKVVDGESSARFTLINIVPKESCEPNERRIRRRPAGMRFLMPSVFTIGLRDRDGHHKRILHFTAINDRDEGTYTCEVRDIDGKTHAKKININVMPKIEWFEPAEEVGALVGEPLTIDCGVKNPQATITITGENGDPVDESLFTIVGTELTVQSLRKEYNGKTITCVASEYVTESDDTTSEARDVRIDAWYRPEFEDDRVDRFAIVGQPGIINCNVSDSNPRPAHFTFYKDNVELTDPMKYTMHVNVKDNTASLQIHKITEDDLGEYRCDVSNKKATGTQYIELKEASAPSEVKASLHHVGRHSFTWKIEVPTEEGHLPVDNIHIQYLRKSLFDSDEDETDEERIWESSSTKTVHRTGEKQLYHIGGLRTDEEYVFRFRAENQAGKGDPVEITASTSSGQEDAPSQSSSITLPLCSLLVLLFSLLS